MRRHKRSLIAVSMILLALVAGITGTTWGMLSAAPGAAGSRRRNGIEKGIALEAERKARNRTGEALDEMSSQVIEDWLAKTRPAHSFATAVP